MEKLCKKDISALIEFEKFGDRFIQIRHNPDTGWYLYERYGKSKKHFEVVRGKKHHNPDGTIVYAYPSSEDWGTYGYTVDNNWFAEDLIKFIMSAKSHTPQELYDFKKSLVYPK